MLLLLGACSSGADAGQEHVACATGGGTALRNDCVVERSRDGNGVILTVRDGQGGFRRLRIVDDGRGVIAADGADAVAVSLSQPGMIDVTVGEDRYRLPAHERQEGKGR
ncbi:MAG: hypothetical protein DI547_12635 [Sphingobium sp.]|nr:MAG: hypothetical protein DI547_12635 [Sphingobium sp.]